jgi:protein gp37
MAKSSIEWTESTWNPIVGCSILTPGCTNCYAMKMAARIQKMNRTGGSNSNYVNHYDGTTKNVNGNMVWTGKLALAPDKIFLQPLSRKAPTTYFVNSMGDLFHEDCPDEWIDRVFAVMALAPQHTFQVLTKRAARMRQWFAAVRADYLGLAMLTIVDRIPHGHRRVPWPLPNVWLGVSTERQQEADERIPLLLHTPAAIRFISAEPLLGPIDLTAIAAAFRGSREDRSTVRERMDVLRGSDRREHLRQDGTWNHRRLDDPDGDPSWSGNCFPRLDWVIVGGESGPCARPMEPRWAQDLRDQCAAADVPFFFKQWGAHQPVRLKDNKRIDRTKFYFNGHGFPFHQIEDYALVRTGKQNAGRLLDGVEHNAMPRVSP